MNAEAQRRALAASQKAASFVFGDEGDDEGSLMWSKQPQFEVI